MATVENDWNLNVDGTTQFSLCRKLKALKGHLKAFNNLHFSHISVKAKDADLALQDAQIQLESDPENAVIRDSVGELRKKAVFLAEAERHFYYQKAKLHFLKMGDRNTKFFHDMVKRNATKSSIMAITKTDGSTITVVTPEEVKQAIFHISDNKAPGPDGYSACFFKRAWHIVGDQVCTAVLDFFRSVVYLGSSTIVSSPLCPSQTTARRFADYWHSCNVIYKAITKIIADRLTTALKHLTDRCQAAFVGGQSITGNIFLAQEMVRQYTRKRISPRCIINVDLRKVFDSVLWTFLSQVLHGYGFPPIFIAWIMECVSTSSFSVALNGSLHGFFVGKKGLRQGDPMSPALFLLCMEYFSRHIKRKTTDSDFNFHPKCEKLKITHLLFADDLMMFSRGDLPSVHILMECLQEFMDVSGLTVNTSKSSIFTAGIENNMLREILARIEFARGEMPVRYLGIPLAAQRLVWSVSGCKSSHSQWWSLRKSTGFVGIFSGTPNEHQLLGRISVIPKMKAVLVSGIPRLGTWPFLPEFYGTSTARQTRFGYSGSTLFISKADQFGTSNRGRAIHHSFNGLPKSAADITAFGIRGGNPAHAGWSSSKGLDTSKAYEYFRPK
ncbi:UNVERIFIED_CONTAM: hypothetical protein Sradi_4169100 [Sesamum radiatum]|uniref:Reverse transcriptase domain-containing protein n=1 Tax=Sesamum radiatum TaxID=300843 RepID=A0AAW2P5K0_SESRA